MEKIKVIVASRPRVMREILVEMISNQPDIELVAEVQDDTTLIDLVGKLNPDWLFIALDHPDRRPDICDPLLGKCPNLKILAIASEKSSCILYWATLTIRSRWVESSEKGILDALRGCRQVVTAVVGMTESKKVN